MSDKKTVRSVAYTNTRRDQSGRRKQKFVWLATVDQIILCYHSCNLSFPFDTIVTQLLPKASKSGNSGCIYNTRFKNLSTNMKGKRQQDNEISTNSWTASSPSATGQ